jgi:beta-galactosidase
LAALVLSAFLGLSASIFLCLTSCSNRPETVANAKTISFDEDWHFLKDSLSGAEYPHFNDSNWRVLDVPHDWSIEDLPGQNGTIILSVCCLA